jgi:hypothetical protein
MVDYNNEVTISKPAQDIERIQVLERRAYAIDALGKYKESRAKKIRDGSEELFKASMLKLLSQVQGMYKRIKGDAQYRTLKKTIEEGKIKEQEEQLEIINDFLDEIHLTRLDLKTKRNRSNAFDNYDNDKKDG